MIILLVRLAGVVSAFGSYEVNLASSELASHGGLASYDTSKGFRTTFCFFQRATELPTACFPNRLRDELRCRGVLVSLRHPLRNIVGRPPLSDGALLDNTVLASCDPRNFHPFETDLTVWRAHRHHKGLYLFPQQPCATRKMKEKKLQTAIDSLRTWKYWLWLPGRKTGFN